MSDTGHLRVGDDERDQAVHDLRQHGIAGRLTSEEVGTRIFRAGQARTVSDLDQLFADLPWGGSRRPPTPSVVHAASTPARPGPRSTPRREGVGVWAVLALGLFLAATLGYVNLHVLGLVTLAALVVSILVVTGRRLGGRGAS